MDTNPPANPLDLTPAEEAYLASLEAIGGERRHLVVLALPRYALLLALGLLHVVPTEAGEIVVGGSARELREPPKPPNAIAGVMLRRVLEATQGRLLARDGKNLTLELWNQTLTAHLDDTPPSQRETQGRLLGHQLILYHSRHACDHELAVPVGLLPTTKAQLAQRLLEAASRARSLPE